MDENEIMTDYRFSKLLQMVLKVLEDCKNLDDAKAKAADLLEEKSN